MRMTLDDIVDQGLEAAEEIGNFLEYLLQITYAADNEVIAKYVLILGIAGLLMLGLRLLRDEIAEYRGRMENEARRLPWYLRNWALSLAIILLYAVIIVLILR